MTKLTILAIITAALASGQVEAFRFRFCEPVFQHFGGRNC